MAGKVGEGEGFLEAGGLPKGPVRAFLALFSGLWGRMAAAAAVFVIKHSPVWLTPIVTANVINLIVSGRPGAWEEALLEGGLLGLAIAQNIPTHTLYASLLNGAVRSMESRTRMALIRRLQALTLGSLDSSRSGAIQNKVLRDVESVGSMASQFINTVLSTLVTLCIAFVMTLAKQPSMALFFLLTVPVAVGLVWAFRKPLAGNTQRYRKALEGMTIRVSEMLTMLPVTRAHAVEDFEAQRMSEAMEDVRAAGRKADVLNGVFGASTWAVFQASGLLCLLFSGYLCAKGLIPVGDVVLYQSFFMSIVGGVSAVVSILPDIAKGFNAVSSIGEILGEGELEQEGPRERLPDIRGEIDIENLSFAYPPRGSAKPRPVLDGLSLKVEAGTTVAFVGESGSGKSTLMSLLVGFHRPLGGRILLDGHDLRDIDLRDYRRRLSVVSQSTVLFSASIRDNVSYGCEGVSDGRIREVLEEANAWSFVSALGEGLDTQLGENGCRLSGGQRQRLAIARALVRDPRVIILDEATSALDNESERLVKEAFARLCADRTTLVVAHRLSTVMDADAIAVLKAGRLVELGSHAELLRSGGEYARLYAAGLGGEAGEDESGEGE
jgi:ATP-binding cassette, subfamily B, bacterial